MIKTPEKTVLSRQCETAARGCQSVVGAVWQDGCGHAIAQSDRKRYK